MKNQFNETGTDFGKTQSLPKLRKYELIQDFSFPWIVKPGYFVQMGFSDVFVRQYVKKHDKAAKPNGEIICGPLLKPLGHIHPTRTACNCI
jgi:hypothetical protein